MAGAQNGGGQVWRVLAGVGAIGLGIGLIGGVPTLTLLGALVVFVGLIGHMVAGRK